MEAGVVMWIIMFFILPVFCIVSMAAGESPCNTGNVIFVCVLFAIGLLPIPIGLLMYHDEKVEKANSLRHMYEFDMMETNPKDMKGGDLE